MNRILLAVLIMISGASLSSISGCSGEAETEGVNVKLNPGRPTVINADLTLRPGTPTEEKISAPWFKFSYEIENTTDETITIVSFKIKLTAIVNGQITTYENSLDPGDIVPAQTILNEIPAGDTQNGVGWYLGGLPKSESFIFSGTATAVGWFGDDQNPKNRLQIAVPLTTQQTLN